MHFVQMWLAVVVISWVSRMGNILFYAVTDRRLLVQRRDRMLCCGVALFV